MDEPRLKAKLRVQAMLRQAQTQGATGAVILAVLRGRDGLCVLSQMRVEDGRLAWLRATGPEPVDEQAADAYIARQLGFDPDLWVVEFDTPTLTPPFDAELVVK
jgi:hypothetical protein